MMTGWHSITISPLEQIHSFHAFVAPLEQERASWDSRVNPSLTTTSLPATGMPKLARNPQCINEPRGLDLDVVPQHEFLRVRMEVHLLVHPLRHWTTVQVVL
jgi:hypothetical protein